jgi:predicted nucleic acid-binding protein
VTLIVSDNSPLNLLIRIGLAEILPKLFTLVVIPPEVAQEMRHHKAPQPVRDFISSPPSWLKIMVPETLIQFPKLDPGESAAISLAVELRAILLIDEHDGRDAGRSRRGRHRRVGASGQL